MKQVYYFRPSEVYAVPSLMPMMDSVQNGWSKLHFVNCLAAEKLELEKDQVPSRPLRRCSPIFIHWIQTHSSNRAQGLEDLKSQHAHEESFKLK
jgi:hypothetical protein